MILAYRSQLAMKRWLRRQWSTAIVHDNWRLIGCELPNCVKNTAAVFTNVKLAWKSLVLHLQPRLMVSSRAKLAYSTE